MNKTISLSFILILICSLLLFSGCGNAPVYSNNETQQAPATQPQMPATTTVQTIGEPYATTKSWDADPEVDGLEFDLAPKDKDDNMVEADGKISIKLYETVEVGYVSKCLKRSEDLLESWDNIPVSKKDYSLFGATIRAEYKTYKLTSDEYSTGCAEITFTTSDGKIFTALSDTIFINGI